MAPSLGIFTIGRQSSRSRSTIQIPPGVPGQDSISRDHLEVTLTADGRYYINDLDSVNGTYLKERGQWQPVRQTFADPDAPIKLGDYETTLRELLARQATPPPVPAAPVVKPPPIPSQNKPQASRMVRCVCGSIKEREKTCPHCGA